MKVISQEDVYRLLTPGDCIPIMEDALKKLAGGVSCQYLRTAIPLPNHNILGMMPCYLDDHYFGVKVITVFHTNCGTEFPSHQGAVLIFDSKNGTLKASVDATAITQVRTGAVSAVVTDLLARKDASVLALLGSGAQARSHLEAISKVRRIKQVLVWDVRENWAEKFAQDMHEKFGLPITVCHTVEEAVGDADIVCTVTASKTPILKGAWLKPGVHLNAVGACSANDREVDTETVVRAKLYCDSVDSLMNEAGDFLIPRKEGAVTDDHVVGTVGDLMLGKIEGRRSQEEITMFEAQGLAIEDISAAVYVYQKRMKAANP